MRNILFCALTLLLITSCNKEKRYIYEVKGQELYQNASEKKNPKTTTQFISIAYNDLFGSSITNQELNQFDISLQSFGDKDVLHDMIVKSLINRSGTQVPANNAMRADIPTFVEVAFLRFYNRKPNEFEAWKMKDLIEKNTDITPKMVYYSMMTGEEYQYY
jgi:hypothetical protein